MKTCETPLCEGTTVRARYCRQCYERRRAQSVERRSWCTHYAKSEKRLAAHREAARDYRAAGKEPRGVCVYCDGSTSSTKNTRCLPCYRAKVLPRARLKGLQRSREARTHERG